MKTCDGSPAFAVAPARGHILWRPLVAGDGVVTEVREILFERLEFGSAITGGCQVFGEVKNGQGLIS